MNTIPNNVDWSATAAWIALAISIIGTILGPIVTTVLTNHHQLKLLEMESKNKALLEKHTAITNCISGIGLCVAHLSVDSLTSFSRYFHNVYVYVPQEKWPLFDSFYEAVISHTQTDVLELCPDIIHYLTSLLVEEHQ